MPFFISIRNIVRSNLLVLNLFRIPCRPSKTFVSFYAAVCKFQRPKHTSRTYCRFSLKLRNIFHNGFMPFLTDIIAINSVIFSCLSHSVVQKLRAYQALLKRVILPKTKREGRHSRTNSNISSTQCCVVKTFHAIFR